MVRRSASIAAPPEKIFPMIDDLRAQSAWSPFEKDPNMKRTHSGAPRGKGAVYAWDGNRQVDKRDRNHRVGAVVESCAAVRHGPAV